LARVGRPRVNGVKGFSMLVVIDHSNDSLSIERLVKVDEWIVCLSVYIRQLLKFLIYLN